MPDYLDEKLGPPLLVVDGVEQLPRRTRIEVVGATVADVEGVGDEPGKKVLTIAGGGGGLPAPLTYVDGVLRIDTSGSTPAFAAGPATDVPGWASAALGTWRLPRTFSLNARNNADNGDLVLCSMNAVAPGNDVLTCGYNPDSPPSRFPAGWQWFTKVGTAYVWFSGTGTELGRFADSGGAGFALPDNPSFTTPTGKFNNFIVCGEAVGRATTNGFITELSYCDNSTTGDISVKKRDRNARHVVTTDNTPTTLLTYLVPPHTSVAFDLIINANTETTGLKNGYFVRGVAGRHSSGSSVEIFGTPIVEPFEQEAGWDVTVTTDGYQNLLIQVTGANGVTIVWLESGDFQVLTQ